MNRDTLETLLVSPAELLDDAEPFVRRAAVSALVPMVDDATVRRRLENLLASDVDARVRAEAAEALGAAGSVVLESLMQAAADPDPLVLEAVCTALGEVEDEAAVPLLVEVARSNGDKLTREAAVAALGAIGDAAAVPTLLDLVVSAPPQVRRRSVVALTVFEMPEAQAAIEAALDDRNPMVREAAEMVVGRRLPRDECSVAEVRCP